MDIGRKKTFKAMIEKVLKGFPFLALNRAYPRRVCYWSDIDDGNETTTTRVPEDVREGHFAVIAMQGEETKRFVVELDYLTDPSFLRLLEEAREEYGFGQKGALVVPCSPQELQKIIENRQGNSVTS
ncbi:auxin-responsive protein SAUR32-like [Abrus precatorius]|uniref:Auxin-responsive protein SAUR32-like n=1 Tax=Abrus precatorius TaxID=3816 RepID=A0A8B8KZ05_ABRPR|nr:auxin-responsive protein SAUR32-like [Abrus precatorius]